MPKIKIDYSNTIFYKIYCKDPSITELYIGHTTNFVQRKHSHKQGCINAKSANYKCKVYNVIRDNMGWDNWKMEIIAFHNCEDLYSAKKQEQQYFEEYKATLNSIEPLPPRKLKPISIIDKIPREPLYCETCKVYFNTHKLQDEHNKRPRHIKLLHGSNENLILKKANVSSTKFTCIKCNFKCIYKSDWDRHILTAIHNLDINGKPSKPSKNTLTCECGKIYKNNSGLWKHKQKQKCTFGKNASNNISTSESVDSSLALELLKQNQDFKNLMIEQHKQLQEQNKQILDLAKIFGNTTNNTSA